MASTSAKRRGPLADYFASISQQAGRNVLDGVDPYEISRPEWMEDVLHLLSVWLCGHVVVMEPVKLWWTMSAVTDLYNYPLLCPYCHNDVMVSKIYLILLINFNWDEAMLTLIRYKQDTSGTYSQCKHCLMCVVVFVCVCGDADSVPVVFHKAGLSWFCAVDKHGHKHWMIVPISGEWILQKWRVFLW